MLTDKVKTKILADFSSQSGTNPDRRVILVSRTDGNFRVINANGDSVLYDHRGCEVITHFYIEGKESSAGTPLEATFELLPES